MMTSTRSNAFGTFFSETLCGNYKLMWQVIDKLSEEIMYPSVWWWDIATSTLYVLQIRSGKRLIKKFDYIICLQQRLI